MLRAFRNDPDRFRITVAGTLRYAQQVIRNDPPDLILADWNLPDGKGIEILPRRSDGMVICPLIIMTSHGDEQLAVEIMKSGAIDYVVKSATVFKDLPRIALRALREWESIHERHDAQDAIHASEIRYRFLVDNIREIVWQATPDLTFTYMSPAVTPLLGYTPEELVGKNLLSLLTESSADEVISRLRERIATAAGGEPVPATIFEIGARKKDGSVIWLEVSSNPVCSPDNELTGFHGITRDITERKQAQMAFAESEARFRNLFGAMNASAVIYEMADGGEDFIIRDINRAAERIEGVQREVVLGHSVLEIFPGVKEFGLFAVFQRVAATNVAESSPTSFYHDNRIADWGENFVFRLPSGEIVALYEDVTEKKQSEEAIVSAREWLGIALRAAKAGTWDWGVPSGRLTWSPELFDLFGLSPDTPATFDTWLSVLHPDDREPARALVDLSVKDRTSLWNEYRIILPDHRIRWIGAAGNTRYDEKGRPLRMSGVCIDITDRKSAEERLHESEERLHLATEAGRIGTYSYDFGSGALYISPELRMIYGLDADAAVELDRDNVYAGVHPGDRDLFLSAMLRANDPESGGAFRLEYRIIRPDGTTRWLQRRGRTEFTGTGGDARPCRAYGAIVDITELKEAGERLRLHSLILETMNEGVCLIRTGDSVIVYTNPRFNAMFGYDPGELDGRHISVVNAGEEQQSPEEVAEKIAGRLREDGVWSGEVLNVRKNGSTVWCQASVTSFVHPQFGPVWITTQQDISDRRVTEEIRRSYEARLNTAREIGSLAWGEMDLPEGSVRFDARKAGMLGYPPERFHHYKDFTALLHSDDLEPAMRAMQDHLDGKESRYHIDYRIRTADENYLWFRDVGGITKHHPDGTPQTVTGIVIDITAGKEGEIHLRDALVEQKRIEQALLESEERLRLALEGADIASWDWDLKTNNAVFSKKFYTMLDYKPGEFPATFEGWIVHMHPEDRQRVLPDLQRQIREKQPLCEIEYRVLTRDGNWVWILSRGKIAGLDDKGIPSRMTGVNIDITNRRLMESEIRSLNIVLEQRVKDRTEALRKVNADLEEENAQRLTAEQQLRASVDEKTMLLKEVHHRVKNNLQIIASLLNLQSRYIKDEATLAAIRESQNRVKAMSLVHEKLYKSESLSRIDLHDYIRFLGTGLFQFYGAKSRGIQLSLDISNVDLGINATIPLGLIINELISNSLKYAFPEGRKGEISISVRRDDHALTIVYQDNGIGIPSELDWRNTQSLGLRLVNTLVDQMDGTVDLDRTGGTKFMIVVNEKT